MMVVISSSARNLSFSTRRDARPGRARDGGGDDHGGKHQRLRLAGKLQADPGGGGAADEQLPLGAGVEHPGPEGERDADAAQRQRHGAERGFGEAVGAAERGLEQGEIGGDRVAAAQRDQHGADAKGEHDGGEAGQHRARQQVACGRNRRRVSGVTQHLPCRGRGARR